MEICPNHELRTSAAMSTNNKRKNEYRNLNISNLLQIKMFFMNKIVLKVKKKNFKNIGPYM